jgi:hypothetical protein
MTSATKNVGNKIVFENEKIRVWDFKLEPGEVTPLHKHENSYMWYAIKGADLDCKDENGDDLGIIKVPTSGVFNIKHEDGVLEVLSDDYKGATMPATHTAKNISDETYHEILVEFKE